MKTSTASDRWAGLLLGLLGLVGCANGGDEGRDPGDDPPDAGPAVGTPDAGSSDPGGGGAPILPENLIDDLEDGDALLQMRGGRVGAWYTYNDRSAAGTQTPAAGAPFMATPGGAGSPGFHANTRGSGFAVWGAGMGFDLNNPDNAKLPYDASRFTGIQFQAKGSGPVRASVMIMGVLSTEVGGSCVPSTTPGEGCDDGHGSALFLTGAWKTYQLPFAQIRQAGWGKSVAFDATKVMAVQFNVDKNVVFDVSVDDIGFY